MKEKEQLAEYFHTANYHIYDVKIVEEFLAGSSGETTSPGGVYLLENRQLRMAYMYVSLPPDSPDAAILPPGLGKLLNGRRSLYEAYIISTFLRQSTKDEAECGKILETVKLLAAENRCSLRYAPELTAEDLSHALAALEIPADVKMVVHSGYASLGGVAGGPAAVARALISHCGKSGVLMMPSFDFPYYLRKNDDAFFDLLETPSCVGAVTDEFRKLPGVYRSLNPSHSIAVYGKNNFHWIKDHHKTLTMGKDSPLGRLESSGGYALMIHCPDSVTFMHVVETSHRVHCLGYRNEEYFTRLPDGTLKKIRTWGWRNGECPAYDREKIFAFLREKGLIREIMVRHSLWQFFKLADYRQAYENTVIHGADGCVSCPLAPRQTPDNVDPDWDWENSCVNAGSSAFTGDWEY